VNVTEVFEVTPPWAPERPQTFGDLVQRAMRLLEGEECAEPRRQAIQIFRALRGAEMYSAPLPDADTVIDGKAADEFICAAEEVGMGRPLAYCAGWTGFRHLTLFTDPRALVPRPETEGLIDLALNRVRTGIAADIGTGTGAIALSLAHEGDFRQVIGTDVSRDALVLARRNGRHTGLKVSWRLGDLLTPLRGKPVDLLVSNPPYLSVLEFDKLDYSVKEWEPATALIGGSDGLEFYRRLLAEGPALLNAGGWIALEIDARRPQQTAEIATAHGWQDVHIFDDLFGRARYLLARRETMP
jgi:release factor glutamine methyltransferase